MRSARRLLGALVAVGLVLVLLGSSHFGPFLSILPGLGAGRASASVARIAAAGGGAPAAFEPVLGLPGTNVVVFGASPQEASGEVWAYGTLGDVPAIVNGTPYARQYTLLEHTNASGWQVVPLPPRTGGGPLSANEASSRFPMSLGALGGRTTVSGGVVLLTDGGIVVRDPGGPPQLVPPVSPQLDPAMLEGGESLPPSSPPEHSSTPFAAIDDTVAQTGARHTGILVAPYEDGAKSVPGGPVAPVGTAASGGPAAPSGPGILHYDGVEWSREPIVPAGEPAALTPEAIACGDTVAEAAGPGGNCWLLAAYKSEVAAAAPDRVALFRRLSAAKTASNPSGYEWKEEAVVADPQPLLGKQTPPLGEPLAVTSLGEGAQMLTVTSQGAWVDFQAKLGAAPAADVSKLVIPSSSTTVEVAGTWCHPLGTICSQAQDRPLGAPLPGQYQSFAWPGSGVDPGTRVITGLAHGARLELSEGSFTYEIGAGGDVGGEGGAAFSSAQEGWIGNGKGTNTVDREGQSQVIDATPQPQGDQLQSEPVPFRYPLLAVAQAPGSTQGDPGAQAVAVGARGEIGRYLPGQGWRPESLYDAAGRTQTPTLRGVAWPMPGRAYAVGDNGAMWLWRADTDLWEPDPAKPLNFIGNLAAVAFSPTNSDLGYAVGKDGSLLRFGKSWEQVPLPVELQHVNFTSVTFAGGEALLSYRTVVSNGTVEAGGVAVEEDGSGAHWHVDPAASALLAQLPSPADTVLSKVAGLPDGGAVAAGPGLVIERDSLGSPWRFSAQPLAEAQNVSALGAYRNSSGALRAVVSIDLDPFLDPNFGAVQTGPWSGDVPAPTGPGRPPPFAPPDPLPNTGYLLEETASGWSDMEHMALQAPSGGDMPVRPDPVLGLIVSPAGNAGLAVGGQTYDSAGASNGSSFTGPEAGFETAAALRFGGGASAVVADGPSTVVTATGHATFAVGGDAACAEACADLAGEGIGPDVSLTHALASAAQIASSSPGGLRGFLYTGRRLPGVCGGGECAEAFERELGRYASLFGAAGALPVHVAAAPSDLSPQAGGLAPFSSALAPFGPTAAGAYYSFTSLGASGGPVTVIVLDYSSGSLGAAQQEWLRGQLATAKQQGVPAIVMGNAALGFTLPDGDRPLEAADAVAVAGILAEGGASAYLFDYPSADVQTQIDADGTRIPAFGTGTLGYTTLPGRFATDYLGSSGFLLVDVETAARNPATNVAPVSARIEPNIGQLALDASDGVLLRRSQVALFEALARRPAQGVAVSQDQGGGVVLTGAEPYDPIPFDCLGPNCGDSLPTDYTFTSSNPDIGDFIAHDPTSANPRQALLGANQLPVPDPKSGLFCAFNAGTTTISITTGGLTYSEPVTVQGGSVEYPCGTVPLKNPPVAEVAARASFNVPEPPLASSPPPVSPHIQSVVPPPAPVAPTPRPVHHVAVHHRVVAATVLPFVPLVQPLAGARPAIVPPPAPPAARPIPPSGTSQVSQTVGAAEKEREEESATEIASSGKFAAYDANARGGPGPWIPLLAILAAGAGVGIGRGRRSSSRERPALALARSRRRGL